MGGLGNSSRRYFYGPGIDNWDLALLKDVKVHEGKTLELRAEFFDVFNHAQFNGNFIVDGTVDDGPGAFGFPETGASKARTGQMAVKFRF